MTREDGLFADRLAVDAAVLQAVHPVSLAFLSPLTPAAEPLPDVIAAIPPTLLTGLRTVAFGSPKHLAFPELIRRSYRRRAVQIDRDDKRSHFG